MKLLFVSLGCDKNLADSEHMLATLQKHGYELTDDEAQAQVIIVNTCCFIHDAMEESINAILEMAQYKETGALRALIVAGCLAQRFAEEITKEIPEVDGIVGTGSYDAILSVIEQTLEGEHVLCCGPLQGLPQDEDGRLLSTGGHFAYLKIAEGCDKRCTYCVIPSVRGHYRSIPMDRLLREAEQLAKDGVSEMVLVAQETTVYGRDLTGNIMLPELLRKLSDIEGIRWIRLLYCYPEEITEELARTMASLPKVCHYIDMPIQHCSNRLLQRMGRRTSKEDIMDKIAMLRELMPDIAIRTTLICGFPEESKAEHEELLQFIRDMQFDRLGAFAYSREDGTPAAKFDGQIAQEIKDERVSAVMECQQEISLRKNRSMIGRELTVFVEGKVADEEAYVGRTYRDAPDVDGYIFFESPRELMSGEYVRIRVTEAAEYDLIGELIS